MAFSSISSAITSCSLSSTFPIKSVNKSVSPSSPSIALFRRTLRPFLSKAYSANYQRWRNRHFYIKAQTLDFAGSLFDGDFEENDDNDGEDDLIIPAWTDTEVEVEEPECPPGLRKYETMAVLRPDMSEDERIALTQKYEELLVAGGGMYVQIFNRGVIPLAYDIKKKNKAGETNTYMDGIYLLFTYFTKPSSLSILEETLKKDDDVIRSSTIKVRKRKY